MWSIRTELYWLLLCSINDLQLKHSIEKLIQSALDHQRLPISSPIASPFGGDQYDLHETMNGVLRLDVNIAVVNNKFVLRKRLKEALAPCCPIPLSSRESKTNVNRRNCSDWVHIMRGENHSRTLPQTFPHLRSNKSTSWHLTTG